VKLTFIGLGLMGKPMAINHAKGGTDLTVVNRSQGKVQELVDMGAKDGGTPAQASAEADVVALCLQGEDVIEQVLIGNKGVLSTARRGTVVLDHSTIHPESAKRFAAICAEHGVTYLDAPVSGTGKVAWNGQLTIMVGGDAEVFEKIKPLLEPVSVGAYLVGPVGSGNITKLMNNMIGDVNQIIIMEAFALAAALKLNMAVLLEVLQSASANSRQLGRIGPKLLARDFGNQTSHLSGHHTSQGHMRWLSDQVGLDLPLRAAAEDFWKRGIEAGMGSGDPIEAVKLFEEQSGVEVSGS
jgi:3-hydroxyisobutyrate dehydrogenase-like beta-hydroxyacid dehydrogenase